jgi:uncharacterized protein
VIRLSNGEGNVEAVFLPPTISTRSAARYPVLIFTHGNGQVMDDWVNRLDGFRERGLAVLLVEYPGYGRSKGTPSESSIRSALTAAYDRLVMDTRINPAQIIGYGQSLGGGAICQLANERKLAALILQSTFPSLDIFPQTYGAPAFLLRDRFDNEAALKRFTGPVLILHGRADDMIPWQLGEHLASRSQRATFRLHACNHYCPFTSLIWQDIDQFLKRANII